MTKTLDKDSVEFESRVSRARDAIMVFAMGGNKAAALGGVIALCETVYADEPDLTKLDQDPHMAFMQAVSDLDQAETKLAEAKARVEETREALFAKLPVLKL